MKHPWMPLHITAFQEDTVELDAAEIGVYLTMLMLGWKRHDAALPNDMRWLKRSLAANINGFHGHTFNRIVPKLLERYFRLGGDDKWRQKRLTNERQIADKISANAAQNVGKRWAKYKENNDLVDTGVILSNTYPNNNKEEKNLFSGEGKGGDHVHKRPPKHGAISRKRGTIFILKESPDWDLYVADLKQKQPFIEPLPNRDGGYWFPYPEAKRA